MQRRTRFLVTWLVLVAMVVLAGCSGKKIDPTTGTVTEPPKAADQQPKAGGTLRLHYPNVATIDPQLNSFGLWLGMDGLFEGLVRYDATYTKVQGAVAEKWDISADGKVYTFHLRKDAKWSNGDPLTADDFVFAYRRLIDPATKAFVSWGPTYLKNYQAIKDGKAKPDQLGAKAIDANTLELTLENPASDFLITMTLPTALPVPKKVIEQYGPKWTDLDKFVSNGSFKLDKFELNTKIEMVANPNYWGDKPKLDRVVLYLNPSQLMEFENDEVEIMPVNIADLDTAKNDAKLSKGLVELNIKNYDLLTYPVNSEPAVYNKSFRQALAMAIDKEQITKTVMKGTATAAWASLPEGVPGHDDSLGLQYDVAKAKGLMAQAGFADGKGAPPVHILVNGINPPPFVLAIKDAWEKNLGLKVEIEALESGAFAQKRNAIQPAGQVTVFTTAYQVSYASPRVVHTYASKDVGKTTTLSMADRIALVNAQTAANSEKDAAKKQQLIAANTQFLNDKASADGKQYEAWYEEIYKGASADKELELFKKIQQWDRQNAFLVPLFWQKAFMLVKPSVQNFKPNPFMNGRFYFADVWMDSSKK
jgi:oligopeptide transport system substrate-binding protein